MAFSVGAAYITVVPQLSSAFKSDMSRQLSSPATAAATSAGTEAGRSFTSRFGGALKIGALLGGAFAAAKITDFAHGAYTEAVEAQKVTSLTEAVVKSTGGAANVSAGQVSNLANALSLKIGVDDEAIQSGENMLLTFRNVRNEAGKGNDIFNQATVAASDMAAAFGGDATSNSKILGKALNDPIAGVSALTRVGVSFTAQQKDQIAAMVESGNTLGAQKVVLKELSKQTAGAAESQATAGAKMTVAWENFKEVVGLAVMPVITAAMGYITGHVIPGFYKLGGAINRYLIQPAKGIFGAFKALSGDDGPQAFGEIMDNVFGNTGQFVGFFRAVGGGVLGLVDGFKSLVSSGGRAGDQVSAVSKVFGAAKGVAENLWRTVKPIIHDIYDFIVDNWPDISATVKKVFDAARDAVKNALGLVEQIVRTATKVLGAIWDRWGDDYLAVVKRVWGTIADVIKGAFKVISGIFKLATDLLKGNWRAAWDDVKKILVDAWDVIKSVIRLGWDTIKGLFRVGGDAIRAILSKAWDLIKAGTKLAWDAIKSLLSNVWGWIKTQLGNAVDGWKLILANTWDAIKSGTGNAWDWVKTKIGTVWDGIKNVLGGVRDWLRNNVLDAFTSVVGAIGSAWARLEGLAAKPINFILGTVYNNGLREAFNWIMDKLGSDFRLDPVSLIPSSSGSGGSASSGAGHGLLEFARGGVVPGPDRKRDTVPAMLRGREAMMVPEFTDLVGGERGVHRLNRAAERARGLGRGNLAANMWAGVGGLGDVWGWVKGNILDEAVGWVQDKFNAAVASATSSLGGSPWARLATAIPMKVASGAIDYVKDKLALSGGDPLVSPTTGGGLAGPILPGGWTKPLTSYAVSATFPRYSSGAYHSGIDLAGPIGTPVFAAHAGKVIQSADYPGYEPRQPDGGNGFKSYGRFVEVAHGGGLSTFVAHLNDRVARLGQMVKAGQLIGHRGDKGNSSGSHTHFEARVGGTPVQPQGFHGIRFDQGGMLPHGGVGGNSSGKPEAVLTAQQWRHIRTLIQRTFVGNRPSGIGAGFLSDHLGRAPLTAPQLKAGYGRALADYRKQLVQARAARERLNTAEKRAADLADRIGKARAADKPVKALLDQQAELKKLTRLRTKDADAQQRQADAANTAVTRAAEAYAAAQQAAIDRARSVSGSIVALGSLGSTPVSSALGLKRMLHNAIRIGRDWSAVVKRLISGGLRGQLLDDFIAQGPSQEAVSLGADLLSSGSIDQVLRMQARLQRIGDRAGVVAAATPRQASRVTVRHGQRLSPEPTDHRSGGGKTVNLNGPIYTQDVNAAARAIQEQERRALALLNVP